MLPTVHKIAAARVKIVMAPHAHVYTEPKGRGASRSMIPSTTRAAENARDPGPLLLSSIMSQGPVNVSLSEESRARGLIAGLPTALAGGPQRLQNNRVEPEATGDL